eukprot:1160317-Pelagomonas_calceolata.AAC.6
MSFLGMQPGNSSCPLAFPHSSASSSSLCANTHKPFRPPDEGKEEQENGHSGFAHRVEGHGDVRKAEVAQAHIESRGHSIGTNCMNYRGADKQIQVHARRKKTMLERGKGREGERMLTGAVSLFEATGKKATVLDIAARAI